MMIETLFSGELANRPYERSMRSPALLCSVVLHAGLIAVMAVVFDRAGADDSDTASRKYSVRLLELGSKELKPVLFAPAMPAPAPASASAAKPAGSSGAGRAPQVPRPGEGAASQPVAAARRIELPAAPNVHIAKQTLLQMNAPADAFLKQSIPVPTAVIWAEKQPAVKQFVAPTRKEQPKPAINVPDAPTFEFPNKELKVADVKVATAKVNNSPLLVRPPATPSPIRVAAPPGGDQIPETVRKGAEQPGVGNLISIPEEPLLAAGLVVVPPANQIAEAHVGGIGNGAGSGNGTGQRAGSSEGAGRAQGEGSGGKGNGGGAGSGVGTGAAAGGAGTGPGKGTGAGAGAATAGSGTGTGSGSSPGDGDGSGLHGVSSSSSGKALRAGTKRITQPTNGKFSVVVFSSTASEAYPESAGLLTGKLVYTVYLKVGLRKSWILQYCLPKNTKIITAKGSTGSLEAPWPFIMLRPDKLAESDSDYIMVHGFVTSNGRFEQLAVVVPGDLPDKQLLLSSLQDWEFRPATNDGQPTSVEVLLIIPRETA